VSPRTNHHKKILSFFLINNHFPITRESIKCDSFLNSFQLTLNRNQVKMWSLKPVILFLLIFVLQNVIDCEDLKKDGAPCMEPQESERSPNNDAESNEGIVKYDGAQLWRLPYSNQTYKNAVLQLQKKFKISMWNLQHSHVDMFVKQPVVQDAKKLLIDSNVPFEVVIDDLQKAIDEENPPHEQIVQWQNRNGEEFYLLWCFLKHLF
jgi:hypothetical protein